MILYVRHKPGWINYVASVQELKEFAEVFESGYHQSTKSLVIGDVSLFNPMMLNILLKLIEENPQLDLYSSQDVVNPVLLSRIPSIIKDPLPQIIGELSVDKYLDSTRDYLSVQNNVPDIPNVMKLRATSMSKRHLNLLTNIFS